MDDKKLEIISLLSKYNKEEIQQMMIIMTYWDEMVKNGIVSENDKNNLPLLSDTKQRQIKEYVSKKIIEQVERNKNGKEKKES